MFLLLFSLPHTTNLAQFILSLYFPFFPLFCQYFSHLLLISLHLTILPSTHLHFTSPIQLFRSLLHPRSLRFYPPLISSSPCSPPHLVILHSCCRVLASALSSRHSCWWHEKMIQTYKTHKRINKWAYDTTVQHTMQQHWPWPWDVKQTNAILNIFLVFWDIPIWDFSYTQDHLLFYISYIWSSARQRAKDAILTWRETAWHAVVFSSQKRQQTRCQCWHRRVELTALWHCGCSSHPNTPLAEPKQQTEHKVKS